MKKTCLMMMMMMMFIMTMMKNNYDEELRLNLILECFLLLLLNYCGFC